MKAQNKIEEIKVYGKTVLIDYEKGEIIFPDDSLSQDDLENIACYLVEEGFLDPVLNNNN
jgi:hypothetical protein